MADKDGPDSPERLAGSAETLSWLAGQVQTSGIGAIFSHAHMIGALSLARSYVQEFAAHRSLGASALEAVAATAVREPPWTTFRQLSLARRSVSRLELS
jgi:hypothetical protein